MIDLRLFRIPAFSASLAINFLTIFVAVGYFLFVAQYLQLVVGLSPARGRPLVRAVGDRLRRRLAPRAADRATASAPPTSSAAASRSRPSGSAC